MSERTLAGLRQLSISIRASALASRRPKRTESDASVLKEMLVAAVLMACVIAISWLRHS